MGYRRTFLVVTAAAIALPAIASAQEQEHVFVTGAMQDQEHVYVTGAAQDREQRVTVLGAAQDREQRVTVLGSADDQRTVAGTPASRTLQTVPVVYEDEPAPAPATTTPSATPPPAAQPHR
jgi:hypothetical protein